MTIPHSYHTPQEEFWAGDFGKEYITRNLSEELLAANLTLFSRALRHAKNISSCLELGANVGMNLRALRLLYPQLLVQGVEINGEAAETLMEHIGTENVFHGSIFDYQICNRWDLTISKTVLIHLHPDLLDKAYEKLYQATRRYIFICEYYNTTPAAITYRGHSDRLFKRDFAREMLDKYDDLVLRDYGFAYHRVLPYMHDDLTWFLKEKRS